MLDGGCSSLRVMAMPCLLAFMVALPAMEAVDVIAIVLLSMIAWMSVIGAPQRPA